MRRRSPEMLDDAQLRPSLPASDLERARAWYAEKLGMVPHREHAGQVLVYGDPMTFTVYRSDFAGTARNTAAGWVVSDLRAVMAGLRRRGVVFEEYDFGELRTVDGVLADPDGGLAAWFKDSEGNILALTQQGEGESAGM
jgi:catechol 2,3-dioxygenase-like lactoylglutathione lyase family enzyme